MVMLSKDPRPVEVSAAETLENLAAVSASTETKTRVASYLASKNDSLDESINDSSDDSRIKSRGDSINDSSDDSQSEVVRLITDGACSGNPGPGGWAAILKWKNHLRELTGGEAQTTNNRMELLAVIMGLEAIKKPMKVVIISDSKYVIDGATVWLENWQKRGWRTSNKKAVKNQDLWERLSLALARHSSVSWQWVRGHNGDPENERADQLSVAAIHKLEAPPNHAPPNHASGTAGGA